VVGPDGKIPGFKAVAGGGPDGQIPMVGPGGTVQMMGPDGKMVQMVQRVGPDGKMQMVGPDGKVHVVGPDGKIPGFKAVAGGGAGHPGGAGMGGFGGGTDAEMIARMVASGMSEADIQAMMGDKYKERILCSTIGGGFSFRTPEESVENARSTLSAFDQAILNHKNRKEITIPELSPESRALMQQIMASGASQEEMASRVAALLAGTALSTSRGLARPQGAGVDTVGYEGTNLSEARQRKDGFEMPEIPSISSFGMPEKGGTFDDPSSNIALGGGSLADRMKMRQGNVGERGSIKRQSAIQREKKKSRQEEREEEKVRNASYYRKVTGLRRAKVPMMVYSCGGFSRCFRVCRFYDVEGPPVGIQYEDRKALNPDL